MHSFRTLILDDLWREDLAARHNYISKILTDVFSTDVSLVPAAEGRPVRLTFALKVPGTIRAGLIRDAYPGECLDEHRRGLRWKYSDDSWPTGIVWARDELGTQVCEWSSSDAPSGFYVGIERKRGTNDLLGYVGREEIFGVTFWPFDRLDDLIGARDRMSRFWNLLILDNLIYKNELNSSRMTWDPASPDLFAGQERLFLFHHFRHPVSDPEVDVRWDPDRRTQAIIEASRETNNASPVVGRKLWPRFQLEKDLLDEGVTNGSISEFRTYSECTSQRPTELPWSEFLSSIQSLASTVYTWHCSPVDDLVDPDGMVARIAATDFPVFFIGFPGTGKSHLARAIHLMSARASPHPAGDDSGGERFHEVNCGAIPREGNFFESTIFGMVRDALWEGSPAQAGILRQADGGTVFLDEVHHLPERLQAALLTFLENGKIRPLGSNQAVEVDVRIIAATNEREVFESAFTDPDHSKLRADFLQRVAFHKIELALLSAREKHEFIDVCKAAFATVKEELSSERGLPLAKVDPVVNARIKAIRIDPDVFLRLYQKLSDEDDHRWKRQFDLGGNVRFLKQLLAKAVIRHWTHDEIVFRHIEEAFDFERLDLTETPQVEPAQAVEQGTAAPTSSAAKILAELEQALEHITGSLTPEGAVADAVAVRCLVELWKVANLFENAPKFRDWAESPHTIDMRGAKLPRIPETARSKWPAIVVFGFLRFIKAEDIRSWDNDARIGAVFSDRHYNEGPEGRVDKAFSQLGYAKAPPSSGAKNRSRLPTLVSLWETLSAERSVFPYMATERANTGYVDAMVSALR